MTTFVIRQDCYVEDDDQGPVNSYTYGPYGHESVVWAIMETIAAATDSKVEEHTPGVPVIHLYPSTEYGGHVSIYIEKLHDADVGLITERTHNHLVSVARAPHDWEV